MGDPGAAVLTDGERSFARSISTLCSDDGTRAALLIVVPSLDTTVCSLESQKFNARLGELPSGVARCRQHGSAVCDGALVRRARRRQARDALGLPRSQLRLELRSCIAELGLLARAIVVIGKDRTIAYVQIVPEVANEPDYDAALKAAPRPHKPTVAANRLHSRFRRAIRSAHRAAYARAGRLLRDRSVRYAVERALAAPSGGVHSLRRSGEHAGRRRAGRWTRQILESGVPILGICYGMQLLARDVGAELVKLDHAEYGPATLVVGDRESPLFDGVPARVAGLDVARRFGRFVAARLSRRSLRRRAATSPQWATRSKKIYGVQFHPEVVHTEHGRAVLDNFLHAGRGPAREIGRWNPSSRASIEDIRARVGSDKVICALSGGVDSAVAATLVARAIGEQLTCIFVDHGLLRQDESEEVLAAFREVLHLNVVAVDARERFLHKLAGRRRSRTQASHHRTRVHRRLRSTKPLRFPASSIWCRVRSIPTSSSRRRRRAKQAIRSNRITTSAGSRRRWGFH